MRAKVKHQQALNYLKSFEDKVRIGLPNLINQSAKAIQSDISKGIAEGIDIHGQPFVPLSLSTIHSKRAKGYKYPERILFATGTMQAVYLAEKATSANFRARLTMPLARQNVGQYHNAGTGAYTIRAKRARALGPLYSETGQMYYAKSVRHPGLPQREWFGVSNRANFMIAKLQEHFFRRIIKET